MWPWAVLKVLGLGLGLMTCGFINIPADQFLDGWNVCPFDCLPDDVSKVAVTLLSRSTSVA